MRGMPNAAWLGLERNWARHFSKGKYVGPASSGSHKLCTKCGEVKTRAGFHKSSAKPDGLQHFCKACAKARRGT